jgi:hypothetical protein
VLAAPRGERRTLPTAENAFLGHGHVCAADSSAMSPSSMVGWPGPYGSYGSSAGFQSSWCMRLRATCSRPSTLRTSSTSPFKITFGSGQSCEVNRILPFVSRETAIVVLSVVPNRSRIFSNYFVGCGGAEAQGSLGLDRRS